MFKFEVKTWWLTFCNILTPSHYIGSMLPYYNLFLPKTNIQWHLKIYPDSKIHGANMGPTWVLSAPDGPHVGPMNLAIRVAAENGVCEMVANHVLRQWFPRLPLCDPVVVWSQGTECVKWFEMDWMPGLHVKLTACMIHQKHHLPCYLHSKNKCLSQTCLCV